MWLCGYVYYPTIIGSYAFRQHQNVDEVLLAGTCATRNATNDKPCIVDIKRCYDLFMSVVVLWVF